MGQVELTIECCICNTQLLTPRRTSVALIWRPVASLESGPAIAARCLANRASSLEAWGIGPGFRTEWSKSVESAIQSIGMNRAFSAGVCATQLLRRCRRLAMIAAPLALSRYHCGTALHKLAHVSNRPHFAKRLALRQSSGAFNSHSFACQFHPLRPRHRENECQEAPESRFLFQNHSIFLRHSARCLIIRVNQRNHAL